MAKVLSALKGKIGGLVDGFLWKFGYSNDTQLVEENDRLKEAANESIAALEAANGLITDLVDQREMLLQYLSDQRLDNQQEARILSAFVIAAAIHSGGSLSVPRAIFQSVTEPEANLDLKFSEDDGVLTAHVSEGQDQPEPEGDQEGSN